MQQSCHHAQLFCFFKSCHNRATCFLKSCHNCATMFSFVFEIVTQSCHHVFFMFLFCNRATIEQPCSFSYICIGIAPKKLNMVARLLHDFKNNKKLNMAARAMPLWHDCWIVARKNKLHDCDTIWSELVPQSWHNVQLLGFFNFFLKSCHSRCTMSSFCFCPQIVPQSATMFVFVFLFFNRAEETNHGGTIVTRFQ